MYHRIRDDYNKFMMIFYLYSFCDNVQIILIHTPIIGFCQKVLANVFCLPLHAIYEHEVIALNI